MVKGLHSKLFSEPGFHIRGCACDECLNPNPEPVHVSVVLAEYFNRHPESLPFSKVWRHVQTYPNYTLKETEEALSLMVKNGKLGCANGRFWLRDNPTKRV